MLDLLCLFLSREVSQYSAVCLFSLIRISSRAIILISASTVFQFCSFVCLFFEVSVKEVFYVILLTKVACITIFRFSYPHVSSVIYLFGIYSVRFSIVIRVVGFLLSM